MEGYLLLNDKREWDSFLLYEITFVNLNSLQPDRKERNIAPWTHRIKELKVLTVPGKNCIHADDQQSLFQKPVRKKNVLNSVVILIGLITSAIFLGKMINALAGDAIAGNQMARITAINIRKGKIAGRDFQNAIVREIVLPAEKQKPLPKPARLKDIKKQIKLQAGRNKNGVSASGNDLQLTVRNQSAYFVNQVVVEVNYLKSNGKVMETDTYQIKSLRPNSFQILSVPFCRHGLKMKYKVKNIYALQRQSLLRVV